MIVLKFGGTSVQNAEWMDRSLSLCARELPRAPLMVASAMSKVTDGLQEIARLVGEGDRDRAMTKLAGLRERHFATAEVFLTGSNQRACAEHLEKTFDDLVAIAGALAVLKDWSKRSNDTILAFGELLSTRLLYHRALERGIPTELLDARETIKTDENYGAANLLEAETRTAVRTLAQPAPGRLLITQGFIGSTLRGVTSTLGRGGSDYTATILGAALEAEEVQIWTDVSGILTSDPRLVKGAKTLPLISYREAAELAYFGAKVIHPATIQPAVNLGIPVLVLNTADPDGPRTRILPDTSEPGVKAIACKKGLTVISIDSSRMLFAYGFLRRIFEIFEKHATPVDLIATSEVSVSMTIDNPSALDAIQRELSQIGAIKVETGKSIVSLVGQALWKDTSFLARTFSALQPTQVRMISLGASDINLSLVVCESETDQAVYRLHTEFFGERS